MYLGGEAMQNNRQDAWTQEEDQLLGEIVLQYIEEGKTQLQAFSEAGEQLSRTPAACGFRWNATLRKRYENEIQQAKKNRRTRAFVKSNQVTASPGIHEIMKGIEDLQRFYLQVGESESFRKIYEENNHLKEKLNDYENRLQKIKELVNVPNTER